MLPCNWAAALLFSACSTQWRRAPDGSVAGLDYAGCRAAADAMGIEWGEAFPGLRAIEAEALRALATTP